MHHRPCNINYPILLSRAFCLSEPGLNIGQIATIKPFARFAFPCDFKHVAARGTPEIARGCNKGQVCPPRRV